MKQFILMICFLGFTLPAAAFAEGTDLNAFDSGGYPALLPDDDRPVMLTLWSTTCSSCLKELSMMKELIDQHPDVAFVFVSVDDFSVADQVTAVLQKNRLTQFSNWLFTENNSARLRYQIDPYWYGELPRTYFFDRNRQRTGVSGVLSKKEYAEKLAKISLGSDL